MLRNRIWPDGANINNWYINAKKGDIELKTQNRQKIHKTQKDEKLISQNDR